MRVKLNFVFFICFKNMIILASVGEKSIVTETDVKDFAEVRHKPGFVDQSLLIKAVLSVDERIILLAPRRSGKSVNISMLKRFFEILPDQEAIAANRKLFEGLKIEKHKSTMNEHFAKHPVLFLDFKKDRPVESYDDAFQLFRDILRRTYKSYAYLQTSDKLHDDEKTDIEEFTDDQKYLTSCLVEEHIYSGFRRLTDYLRRYFGEKVYLLIDEYDSMWSDYVRTENKTKFISSKNKGKLKDIITFYTRLLQWITVRNEHVCRTVLTGSYSMQSIIYAWEDGSELLQFTDFNCRETPKFCKFFGNYSKCTLEPFEYK